VEIGHAAQITKPTRMTRSGQSAANSAVMHNAAFFFDAVVV
jgi:hypothetical protein